MTLKVTEEELAVLIDKTGKGQRVTTPPVTKPSKYHNVRVKLDGITFDSKMEAKRYSELKLMQQAGHISQLIVHEAFLIEVNGYFICNYIGDFSYEEGEQKCVEDVKGVRTDVYKIKKRLLKALYDIDLIEVRA